MLTYATTSQLATLHLSRFNAQEATTFPVDKLERMCHGVPNIGQTEQHQWNADDCVQNGHYFAHVC